MEAENKSKKAEVREKNSSPLEGHVIGSDRYLVSIPSEEGMEERPLAEVIDLAEKVVDVLKKVRVISLKMTTAKDWVDQKGKPYLMEDGAQAVAIMWGIDLFDIKIVKDQSEDEKGKYYIYSASGKAYSKKLRRYIEDIGACSQRDDFFGTADGELKPLSEIDEITIKKSAVTNLFCRIIKACAGLKNVTYEELKAAGIDTDKIQKIKYENGAKKAAATLSKKDMEHRKELWDICLQLTGGNEEEANAKLKAFSSFKTDKGDEKFVDNIKRLTSPKWINSTLGHARKAAEEEGVQVDKEQPNLEESG